MAVQKQTEQQFAAVGKSERGLDLKQIEIEVGLVEAIEDDEAVGPGRFQPPRHVGEVAEVGADFDRDRDGDGAADLGDQIEVALFDLLGVPRGIGGDEVDVEFDGIGAGLLASRGRS